MKLLQVEAEEPPSRPQATSQSFSKTHSLINALAPAHKPRLDEVVVRLERFPVGPQTRAFRKRFYPEIDAAQWNDWRWQARRASARWPSSSVSSCSPTTSATRWSAIGLSAARHHAVLREPDGPRGPAGAAAPHARPGRQRISQDPRRGRRPAGRGRHTAVPGLVHRYPDRVLFLATGFCSTYCRYCTRSRMVGDAGGDYTSAGRNGTRRSIISTTTPRSATC